MQKLKIAKVLKPQGIKGEIKVEMFLTDLDFWKNLKEFEIEGKKYTILNFRSQKNYGYIATNEIKTRNDAETFRNKLLEADKPKTTNSDEFFIEDLENCCVVDEFDNILGYVESVEQYSNVANINILLHGGVKTFPFLKKIIKKVDIDNKKIVVYKNLLEEVLV